MSPVLEATRAERAERQRELDEFLGAISGEMTEAQEAEFEQRVKKIRKLDGRVEKLVEVDERAAKAAAAVAEITPPGAVAGAYVTRERMTYDEHQPAYAYNSFYRDLAAASGVHGFMAHDAQNARERLQRHSVEVEREMRGMAAKERRDFARFMDAEFGDYEARVNPNTTAGTGGEFVPPLWLVSQYAPFVRPDRIAANRVRNMPLPPGIDVINVPKITTGSLTGIQTANAVAVTSQDIVTTSVSANVNTIAGQEDISLQLLEQSPLSMDGVIFDDLTRDYSQRLDLQVLVGTGSNGQHQGVLTQSNQTSNTSITKANAVTCSSTVFADASTTGTQLRSIAAGINFIETLRIAPATAIWVHPRRANNWMVTAFDTTGRPLFTPYANFNAFGLNSPDRPEGLSGELLGLPVFKDGNMPQTCATGAVTGGTGDVIAVVKEDDLWLWEGSLRQRALPEVLSGTLQIRFQVYAYSAFLPTRFPPSTSIITGTTGLAAPTF